MTAAQRRYLRIETGIGATISAVLSGVFVALLFSGRAGVPVAGIDGLIVDALPQTFMIALMSSLVPTLLTRRRVRRGAVAPIARTSRWPRSVAIRIAAITIGATLLAGGLHAALLPLTPQVWPLATVFSAKVAYGAVLGAIVARIAVVVALRDGTT